MVTSMHLTCQGDLVLLNVSHTVWQSFDHPTDTWLIGQSLNVGQKLTSKVSNERFSAGKYYVLVGRDALRAFLNTNPPIQYGLLRYGGAYSYLSYERSRVTLYDGEYPYYYNLHHTYLRLDPDGYLNYYRIDAHKEYESLLELTGGSNCGHPMTCGHYGVCYGDNVCDCPDYADDGNEHHFRQVDPSEPNLGCKPITPLSCSPDTHKFQTLIRLENVTYFGFDSFLAESVHDVDGCQAACLEKCSCKAAIFHYESNISFGNCSLPTEIFTFTHIEPQNVGYDSITFVKVQTPAKKATNSSVMQKVVPSISASMFIVLCVVVGYYVRVLRKRIYTKEIECSPDVVIDTIARFSFEVLRSATQDFKNKLGRGGFGSVFEGTLEGGIRVAVKQLDSVGQGRKEFLAEVNTIGKLHHYNLVRLIGFCDDGLNRLLVYEFMLNGSLDKWIFEQDLAQKLTWGMRQRIIVGIAKGLEYLHENCLQNVIHFDIKPQNILLDRDFNVKISDFGLAKMVDRDQTQVLTVIRGTPGYMAPELTTARVISVKVDVYSFGVLVLEIVCGRRNFGASEGDLLMNLVKVKADEDQLCDLIDERAEDMQQHKEEVAKMMKIAIWCLQPHFIRPTMSMVVKVLQDLSNVDALSDLSYLAMVQEASQIENYETFSTRPIESFLSGPR